MFSKIQMEKDLQKYED